MRTLTTKRINLDINYYFYVNIFFQAHATTLLVVICFRKKKKKRRKNLEKQREKIGEKTTKVIVRSY